MPAYTHYQPAVPTTLGHYLAGVVSALTRSIAVLVAAADDLDISPLGAGAVGGTTLPIRPERTAELLGFSDISENSIDAVASRDFVLQIIGAASMTGVLASRVAHDLLLWSMQEFAFVHFPDRLSGSSSMMPQKRNPFVLEHVQGKAMATSGSFVAAMTVMAAAPFTNSAAVGTEAVTHVFSAAKNLRDALMLLRLMIADAEPNAEAMVTRGRAGETSATWTAEWLVRTGMPFREAHHLVGTIAREAAERGDEFAAAVVGALHRAGYPEFELPDFSDIPLLMVHGGGAGGDNVFSTLRSSKRKLSPLYATHQTRVRRWEASQDRLENAAATLLL